MELANGILLSLTTEQNDYQRAQAEDATAAARMAGVPLHIVYAEGDALIQSDQILQRIMSRTATKPAAVIFEPVGGTALHPVARQAASAGIGWVVLNRDVTYIPELRKLTSAPIFSVGSDHTEIGRIQGRQMSAMLPLGGDILYIEGPSDSDASRQRTIGMMETKPASVHPKMLRGNWTEESAYKAVSSWFHLSTSRQQKIALIAAQDDEMAMGARRAVKDMLTGEERRMWLSIPYIGCDGMPGTGLSWVNNGDMTATVVVPPNAGTAIETFVKAAKAGIQPPERNLTTAVSYPELMKLTPQRSAASAR
jgi:ribose transport system substrate-binding protein